MGIWVGRYAIVDGEVREHGPWMVERRRGEEDEAVRFVVLVEPVDARSAEFCEEVAGAIGDLFAQEELSLTGGVLRALRRAHFNLSEWNRRFAARASRLGRRELRRDPRGPGDDCDGRPGPRLPLAAGWRAAHLDRGPAGRGAHSAATTRFEPQFAVTSMDDTEILLLGSEAEAEAAPPVIGQALEEGADRALAELFLQTRAAKNVHAVQIAELPLPDEVLESGGALDVALPRIPPAGSDVYGAPEPPPAVQVPEPEPAAPAAVAGSVNVPASGPAYERDSRPRELSGRLPRLRQSRVEGAAPGPPWQLLSGGLVAVVAVVVLLVMFVPPLLSEDGAAKLETKLANANNFLAQATLTTDVEDQRDGLEAALAELEEARSIDDADQRVTSLTAVVRQRLDELNAVFELTDVRVVARFEGVLTAPLSPVALASGGGWLWMLDEERGRVFAIDPAGALDAIEVYRSGETYAATEAGDPAAIAWDEVGQRLLVVDRSRVLYALEPGSTPTVLPLRDAGALGTIDAIAAYDANLYVLDVGGGEVWRYLPAGEGFDSERSGLLGAIPLEGASRLLVDRDVYLLTEDGVRSFVGGREGEPQLEGLDRPLASPAGFDEDEERGLIYIADRGNTRIVVEERGGRFVRQYTSPDFLDLRGLTLAEDGETVYVLTGSAVLAFEPPLGATAAAR